MKKLAVLVFALLLVVPAAMADAFTVSSYSVEVRDHDPGLVLNTAPVLAAPATFNLNPGQNTGWFNLFSLWTNEGSVNSDDRVPYGIAATLNFSSPDIVSGTVSGETVGVSLLFGVIQYGNVTWDGPTVVNFGDGGQFTIYLKDSTFSAGFLGLSNCTGANIEAKILYNQSPSEVPEPGTLLLLGSGLVGLGGKLRKKFMQ